MNVSVVHSPQQSVFFMLRDIASTIPAGRAARTKPPMLSDRDRAFALRPIRRQRLHCAVPDALVPLAPGSDVSVADQVAALREYAPDDLLQDLGAGGSSATWAPVARDPKRWLTEYADATMAAWHNLAQSWSSTRAALDRETERIGVAAVRGGLDAVLNTLSSRLRFADDCLFIGSPDYLRGSPDRHPTVRIPLAGRRLHLVPSIGARDALFVHLDETDFVGVAYPARPPRRPAPDGDPLAVVLGAVRARLLRLLDRPYPAGEVAARLGVSAGSATWHCDMLDRAGLVRRERRGQRVLVSRTVAGEELLVLMRPGNGAKTRRMDGAAGN